MGGAFPTRRSDPEDPPHALRQRPRRVELVLCDRDALVPVDGPDDGDVGRPREHLLGRHAEAAVARRVVWPPLEGDSEERVGHGRAGERGAEELDAEEVVRCVSGEGCVRVEGAVAVDREPAQVGDEAQEHLSHQRVAAEGDGLVLEERERRCGGEVPFRRCCGTGQGGVLGGIIAKRVRWVGRMLENGAHARAARAHLRAQGPEEFHIPSLPVKLPPWRSASGQIRAPGVRSVEFGTQPGTYSPLSYRTQLEFFPHSTSPWGHPSSASLLLRHVNPL